MCGGGRGEAEGKGLGRGLAGPPADVITVERHPDGHTYAHTHTLTALGQSFIFLSSRF